MKKGDNLNLMSADAYVQGKCGMCLKEENVRWKNLYVTGSEGTWLCIECEKALIRFITEQKLFAVMALKEYKP